MTNRTKQCDCCETDTIEYDLVYADDDDKKFKKYFKGDEFKVCHWCINKRKKEWLLMVKHTQLFLYLVGALIGMSLITLLVLLI